jgi:hypothetical protein
VWVVELFENLTAQVVFTIDNGTIITLNPTNIPNTTCGTQLGMQIPAGYTNISLVVNVQIGLITKFKNQ